MPGGGGGAGPADGFGFGQGGLTGSSGWSPLFPGDLGFDNFITNYDLNPFNIGTVRTAPQEEQIQLLLGPNIGSIINNIVRHDDNSIIQDFGPTAEPHPIDDLINQERAEQVRKAQEAVRKVDEAAASNLLAHKYNFRINLLDKEHQIINYVFPIYYKHSLTLTAWFRDLDNACYSELLIWTTKNSMSVDLISIKGANTITYTLPEDWMKRMENGSLKKYFYIGSLEAFKGSELKTKRFLIFDKDI